MADKVLSEEETITTIFGFDDNSDSDDDAPEIKYDTYARKVETPESIIQLALVKKHHSLWAEFIYNAARVLADRIDDGRIKVNGLSVLELGAGAGLPGIMAGLCGAKYSVISDYGNTNDRSLIHAIDLNIASFAPKCPNTRFRGVPFVWGYDVSPLIEVLREDNVTDEKFDVVILADLIFNRSEHRKLLQTVKDTLKPHGGMAWVSFSHHDPLKRELDLAFFSIAKDEFGFQVQKVDEEKRVSYPFVEGDGLDDQRGWVYVYTLSL